MNVMDVEPPYNLLIPRRGESSSSHVLAGDLTRGIAEVVTHFGAASTTILAQNLPKRPSLREIPAG